MTTLLFALFIFLDLLYWIIIIDVVLSWLQLFGLRWRPTMIAQILDPMYRFIKSKIPTTVGPFELSAVIVLIGIMFLKGVILASNPAVTDMISTLTQ